MLLSVGASAQEITILDSNTHKPIANVAVFDDDESKMALSDVFGKCDLGIFDQNERITFKHIGYEVYKDLTSRIVRNGRSLFLVQKPEVLDEVILSVSKWEQQKREIPNKIASVDAQTIAFTNPQTAADLLQNTGKVFVQKSQMGGGSPMIRGFATNRLLLSVDGVRMNNAIFRGGNLQNVISIDPFTIRKTEIIFGPGSVIYGSDAIGGVMNFYTKPVLFSSTDSLVVSGNANYRFSSANSENTLNVGISLGNRKWAFLTNATYNSFGDLTMGSHGPESYLRKNYVRTENGIDRLVINDHPKKQVPTGYDQINMLQKVAFRPNRIWNFQLGTYFSQTSDYSRYDRLIRPSGGGVGLRSAEWYYGPQKWFMENLQVDKMGKGTFYDRLKITTAYQYFEESRYDRSFEAPELFSTKEKVAAYSANIDFENKKIGDIRLYYGSEYVFNKVHSSGSVKNIGTGLQSDAASRYPDGSTWQTIAGYITGEYMAKPNFTILSGLRYSHVWIDAIFDNSFYPFPFDNADLSTGALTGSLGFSWLPKEHLQITWNGSTGFRAPNIDDVGKIFDSEPGSVVVPNPNLKPEYAYNTEIGMQKNFNDKMVLTATMFYTYLVDALVRRDFLYNGQSQIDYRGATSNVQAIQNAAKASIYGFEFGSDVFITDNLSLAANLTITKGIEEETDGTDSSARHAAPTFGDFHIIWKHQKVHTDLFLNYNGEITYENLAISERSKAYIYAADNNGNPYAPTWYTLNWRSQYTLSNAWKATLSLANITDQRYRTYSSGIVAPGIDLVLGLSYNF